MRRFRLGAAVFWAEPEPELRDAGLEGELAVARLRIVIILFLFTIPVTYRLGGPLPMPGRVSAWVLSFGLLAGFAFHALARRRQFPRHLAFASSFTDVTLVTAALAIIAAAGSPLTVTNSQYTFAVYFLALGATALRYDRRVCLAAGLAAIVQYGLLVGALLLVWPLRDPSFGDPDYGRFSTHSQLARLILLGAATYLSATIVKRSGQLRRLSVHDPLTGLVNRTFFEERLREELSRARREETRLNVALADLDHFKRVNDHYGHAAGDAVLRAVAASLRSSLRGSDVVARYGGEEFALLLPGAGSEAAAERLKGVRREVRAVGLHPSLGIRETVTVSLGAAGTPEDGLEVSELLAVADRRLYRAKGQGRDRVVARDGEAR